MNQSRSKPMPSRPMLALVLLIALSGVGLGLAMCAVGFSFARDFGTLLWRGEERMAVVESREIRRGTGSGGSWEHGVGYRFSVEGRTVAGEEVVDEAVYNTLPEGASPSVLYEPGNPANHYLAAEFGPLTWLGLPLVALLFGLFVLGAAGFAAVATARSLFGGPPPRLTIS